MDWFAQANDAATRLMNGRVNKTISDAEVNDHPIILNNYVSLRENTYLNLFPNGYDAENDPTGWKFHISIAPEHIIPAFNLIAPNLMTKQICFKVSEEKHHTSLGNMDEDNCGKAIVIFADKTQKIEPLLRQIEQTFHDAGIKPGPSVTNDRKISGSSYIFYRNDQSEAGKYIPAAALDRLHPSQRYNPTGKDDPYRKLDIYPTQNTQSPETDSEIDRLSKELISRAKVSKTTKGDYMGVWDKPEVFESICDALENLGFQFTIKEKSGVNNHQSPVIVLSAEAEKEIAQMQDAYADKMVAAQTLADADKINSPTPQFQGAAHSSDPGKKRDAPVKLKLSDSADLNLQLVLK